MLLPSPHDSLWGDTQYVHRLPSQISQLISSFFRDAYVQDRFIGAKLHTHGFVPSHQQGLALKLTRVSTPSIGFLRVAFNRIYLDESFDWAILHKTLSNPIAVSNLQILIPGTLVHEIHAYGTTMDVHHQLALIRILAACPNIRVLRILFCGTCLPPARRFLSSESVLISALSNVLRPSVGSLLDLTLALPLTHSAADKILDVISQLRKLEMLFIRFDCNDPPPLPSVLCFARILPFLRLLHVSGNTRGYPLFPALSTLVLPSLQAVSTNRERIDMDLLAFLDGLGPRPLQLRIHGHILPVLPPVLQTLLFALALTFDSPLARLQMPILQDVLIFGELHREHERNNRRDQIRKLDVLMTVLLDVALTPALTRVRFANVHRSEIRWLEWLWDDSQRWFHWSEGFQDRNISFQDCDGREIWPVMFLPD